MSVVANDPGPIDIQRLIAEVAARHNFLLHDTDPAMALVTMNQLILGSSLASIHKEIRATIAEFHVSMDKAESRAGSMLADRVKESAAQLRETLQGEIHIAGLKAHEYVHRVNEAHRRPAIIKWSAVGLLAATLIFSGGVWLGIFLHWRF